MLAVEAYGVSKIIFWCFKTAAHCSSVRLGETTVLTEGSSGGNRNSSGEVV